MDYFWGPNKASLNIIQRFINNVSHTVRTTSYMLTRRCTRWQSRPWNHFDRFQHLSTPEIGVFNSSIILIWLCMMKRPHRKNFAFKFIQVDINCDLLQVWLTLSNSRKTWSYFIQLTLPSMFFWPIFPTLLFSLRRDRVIRRKEF